MTFNEGPLYNAVEIVFEEMKKAKANPRADHWNWPPDWDLVFRSIMSHIPADLYSAFAPLQVRKAWACYGKDSSKLNGIKKKRLIVLVARDWGWRCFYADRGLGLCSDGVDLERLTPGNRDGKYTPENCVLACSRHNRQRGKKTIEAYLATGARDRRSGLFEESNP